MGMTVRVSINAFRLRASMGSMSENEFHLFGFFAFILFVVSLVLALLLGKKDQPLGELKYAFVGTGALNLVICISRFITVNGQSMSEAREYGFRIGIGLLLLLVTSIALAAIPFIKPLESGELMQGKQQHPPQQYPPQY